MENSILAEDEIQVKCPVNRDITLSLLIIIIIITLVITLSYFLGEYFYNSVAFDLIFPTGLFVGYFLMDRLLWKLAGNRRIVIDKKYLVIFKTEGSNFKNRAYELSEISAIKTNNRQRTIFHRIKLFCSKDVDDSISFVYKNKKKVNIGTLMTSEDKEKIVRALNSYSGS